MKLFLKSLAYFWLIVPIALLIWYFPIRTYRLGQIDSLMEQVKAHEVILMGDSQIQRIDPTLFDRPTFNLGNYGEHYYFTYLKLMRLVAEGKGNIQTILLGIAPHSFSPVFVKMMDIHTIEGKTNVRRYFFYGLDSVFFQPSDILIPKVARFIYFGWPEAGGFYRTDRVELPDEEIITTSLGNHFDDSRSIAYSQLTYLKKIQAFCKKQGIQLVFVITPYHPGYASRVDQVYLDYFEQVLEQMKDVPIADFRNYQDPTHFEDGNHLNAVGGHLISTKLNDWLKQYERPAESEKMRGKF
jgi:hypothetical protein